MKEWLDAHWGDLIALYLLHLGVLIVWLSHGNTDTSHIGESLILTGAATLRFKGRDKRPE